MYHSLVARLIEDMICSARQNPDTYWFLDVASTLLKMPREVVIENMIKQVKAPKYREVLLTDSQIKARQRQARVEHEKRYYIGPAEGVQLRKHVDQISPLGYPFNR
jgi:hypothetical protein